MSKTLQATPKESFSPLEAGDFCLFNMFFPFLKKIGHSSLEVLLEIGSCLSYKCYFLITVTFLKS